MKKQRIALFAALTITLSLHLTAQTIDVNGKGEPFKHHWSVGTCAGRANEGLRTAWVEQLRLVKEHCGFQYLRMHGMFDDDMFVYFEDRKGNPIYNWQYLDEVYDRMLDIGVKPFVELSFFPKGIAADNSKNFQGIVKPSFHAYRMLNQLGDERLYYQDPLFVSRHSESGKITALVFNYPQEYEQKMPSSADSKTFMQASSKTLDCTLKNLKPGTRFMIETLDFQHGNAYEEWQSMGAPHSPTREQASLLRERAWQTKKDTLRASPEGTLTIKQIISPWTCILIQQL